MKLPKILYFINGASPNAADLKAAHKLKGNVVFRNALFVDNEPHSLELCEGVAGAVPKLYKEKFPTAEDAVSKFEKDLKALTDKTGEEIAPDLNKVPEKTETSKPETPTKPDSQQIAGWKPNT
jgi:hypothetical protein